MADIVASRSVPVRAAETGTTGHVLELDGLRGIAILVVCIFHFSFVMGSCQLPLAHSFQNIVWIGWCGVDLFFALSGFLITGILLDTRHSATYFRTFYVRRALRIFPLYFAFLAIMLGLVHHLLWRHRYPGITTWWYLVYLQNWKPNHTAGDLHVDHLWSLAIEEQFYMVWPLFLWLTPRKWIAPLTLLIGATAMVLRWYIAPGEFMYRGTLTRMDGLALGALVAIVVRTPSLRRALRRGFPFALAISAGSAFTAFAAEGNFRWDRPVQIYGATGLASLFALLVFWCVEFRPSSLRNKFLRSFAKYAYAIYVFHSPLNQILSEKLEPLWPKFSPLMDFGLRCLYIPVMIAVSWCLGWLSWQYVEGPMNRLKRSFPYLENLPLASDAQGARNTLNDG